MMIQRDRGQKGARTRGNMCNDAAADRETDGRTISSLPETARHGAQTRRGCPGSTPTLEERGCGARVWPEISDVVEVFAFGANTHRSTEKKKKNPTNPLSIMTHHHD